MTCIRNGKWSAVATAGWLALCAVGTVSSARAQDTSPVTVPDSPLAWQLFQQATDQARDNPAEAARLAQRLLDGFGDRLVPADQGAGPDSGDRLEGVVDRVERFLKIHPVALERYRQIEGPEAARLLAAGETERVARAYALTHAGLTAHLQLAEHDMQSARFARGLARLRRMEGHPDLIASVSEATTYWFLRGACAALAQLQVERDLADTRLQALGVDDASPERTSIARFAEITPPEAPILRSPLTEGFPPESDEGSWQPVWTEQLSSTPYTRLFLLADELGRTATPRAFERARFDGSYLIVAPSVLGDVVVVSDGETVRAMDRLSHRIMWMRPIDVGRLDRNAGTISDLASVAVGEGCVIVLPGYGFVNERGTLARVTCLGLANGEMRWEAPLGGLGGAEFEDLFPIGEPVISDGTVHVLARKLTSRLETVEYVVALDIKTGALRWATYIAGAGGVNMQGLRPASRMVIADGSVWVASSVGAIARLDAIDGRPQWCQRFLVPIRDARFSTEAWELGGPALIGEWLFSVSPDQATVVQIQRETGRLENTFSLGATNAWGTTRYILADDGDDVRTPRMFAIGADIIAFDPDRPERPLWTLSGANDAALVDRVGLTNRAGIRGRVQLAGELLVVPGIDDVLLVASANGRIRERIEIDGPANPVLLGPQLLLGQNASVTALMPAASAERLMRERIAQDPLDAEGGLALLDLGLRARRLDLCIEAAGLARIAIERTHPSAASDRAREELVDRLLRTAALDEATGIAGAPVHALLSEISLDPSQRVRHLLASAEWRAGQHRIDEAVADLDRIIVDADLVDVPLMRADESSVPAWTEALLRLRAVVAESPTEAAAALARRQEVATARLAAALALHPSETDRSARAKALRAAALASPLTDAGVDAAIAAAREYAGGREWLLAWSTLQRALRVVPITEAQQISAGRLIAEAIETARAAGWTLTERTFAETALGERGSIDVALTDGSRSLQELVAGTKAPVPAVGEQPGEVIQLAGRVVRTAPGATALKSIPGILTVDGQWLSLVRTSDWTPVWRTKVVDRDPAVLVVGEVEGVDALLLWQEPSSRDATASWISLADGTVLASTPPAHEFMPAETLLDAGRPINQQMPNEAPFMASQVLPAVAGHSLVLVRRNGDAAGFDLGTLSTPAWTARRMMDQVYEIGLADWGIAVGGQTEGQRQPGAAGDDGLPVLLVLDPASGAVLTRTELPEDDSIRWLRLLETGELIAGAKSAVLALDGIGSADGTAAPMRWRNASIDVQESVGAWRLGRCIVLATAVDMHDTIVAIDLATAEIDPAAFRPPQRLDNRRSEIRAGGRQGSVGLVQFKDRILAFSLDGALIGEDAIAEVERDFAVALPIADGVLVVSNGGSRQLPTADGSGMRFEATYLLYRLSIDEGLRLLGQAVRVRTIGQRADRWQVIDGYVIVSTNAGALAVPMPVSP